MGSREAIGPARKRGDESAREGPTLFGPSLAWLWRAGLSMREENHLYVRRGYGRRAIGSVVRQTVSMRGSEAGTPQTPGFPPRAPPSAARAGPGARLRTAA